MKVTSQERLADSRFFEFKLKFDTLFCRVLINYYDPQVMCYKLKPTTPPPTVRIYDYTNNQAERINNH